MKKPDIYFTGFQESDREELQKAVSGPYFGLHFDLTGLSHPDKKRLLRFVQSILPQHSKQKYAELIWKFIVTNEGAIREVTRDPQLDPHDTPNRFKFEEVYDRLQSQLSQLGLSEPPPSRTEFDQTAWLEATAQYAQVANYRKSFKGHLHRILSGLGVATFSQSIELPPLPQPTTFREQADRLQDWIDRHLSNGLLVKAIKSYEQLESDS